MIFQNGFLEIWSDLIYKKEAFRTAWVELAVKKYECYVTHNL